MEKEHRRHHDGRVKRKGCRESRGAVKSAGRAPRSRVPAGQSSLRKPARRTGVQRDRRRLGVAPAACFHSSNARRPANAAGDRGHRNPTGSADDPWLINSLAFPGTLDRQKGDERARGVVDRGDPTHRTPTVGQRERTAPFHAIGEGRGRETTPLFGGNGSNRRRQQRLPTAGATRARTRLGVFVPPGHREGTRAVMSHPAGLTHDDVVSAAGPRNRRRSEQGEEEGQGPTHHQPSQSPRSC
jgi:hypothetical protein